MSIKSCVLTILLFTIPIVPAHAQTPRAKAADVRGRAEQRAGKRQEDRWSPIKGGDLLSADSTVRTAADSAVLLVLPDEHVVRIGENTVLDLKELGENNSFSFALLAGRIWSFVDKAKKPAKYEVETPSTILGVSGTLFSVAHDEGSDDTEVSVDEGQVRLRQGQTSKNVDAGSQLRVPRDRLEQTTPVMHTPATAAMWKAIRSEKWAAPGGGSPKLNQQAEEHARAVDQERKNERRPEPQRTPRPAPPHGRGRGRGR
jgi:hypothetical protein